MSEHKEWKLVGLIYAKLSDFYLLNSMFSKHLLNIFVFLTIFTSWEFLCTWSFFSPLHSIFLNCSSVHTLFSWCYQHTIAKRPKNLEKLVISSSESLKLGADTRPCHPITMMSSWAIRISSQGDVLKNSSFFLLAATSLSSCRIFIDPTQTNVVNK